MTRLRFAPLVRAILAMGLGLAAAPALADPAFYYCWAPDPATGKVWVSETRPVGPMAERGSYGTRYAEWLKATGKTATVVQAYCAMRDTAEGLERARGALPQENCRECGSARDFTNASMGGRPRAPMQSPTVVARPAASSPAPRPAPQRPEPAKPNAAPDGGPWIVVLGNVNTGRTVWDQNKPDLENRVRAMATKLAPSGWISLVSAREPGAGAAMCVKDGNRIRFFTAFPRKTSKEAISEARTEANAFAGRVKQTSFICGVWLANDRATPPETNSLYDYLKDKLYEQLKGQCDANLPPVEVNSFGQRVGGAADTGTGAGKPCRVRKMSFIGVRG